MAAIGVWFSNIGVWFSNFGFLIIMQLPNEQLTGEQLLMLKPSTLNLLLQSAPR